MVPEELIGNLGDVHLYSNHIEQAKEQITREPFKLPKMAVIYTKDTKLEDLTVDSFQIINYTFHESIKAPLSN